MLELLLSRSKLVGTLPPELGSLEKLTEMRLHGNELTGTFPNEWSKLGGLWTLQLGSNKLTGNILPKLVILTRLEDLRIDNNQLTGSFPKEFSALKQMAHMIASGNAFSGLVGPRVCKMVNPNKQQQGSPKSLIEFTLDCAVQSNGAAEISCPCRTHAVIPTEPSASPLALKDKVKPARTPSLCFCNRRAWQLQ
jgi:hypothetical protein